MSTKFIFNIMTTHFSVFKNNSPSSIIVYTSHVATIKPMQGISSYHTFLKSTTASKYWFQLLFGLVRISLELLQIYKEFRDFYFTCRLITYPSSPVTRTKYVSHDAFNLQLPLIMKSSDWNTLPDFIVFSWNYLCLKYRLP